MSVTTRPHNAAKAVYTGSAENQSGILAEIILGGQDGIVNTLGLILGLAAATSNTKIIIAGGLAATAAETLSMAAVAYTSKAAERDFYLAQRQRQRKEIEEFPDHEAQELRDEFISHGLSGKLLSDMMSHATADFDRFTDTMLREVLRLFPISQQDVYKFFYTVGIATLIGALLPMLPFFFFPVSVAMWLAIVLSALALAGVGAYKAKTNLGNPLKSSSEMLIIGMAAALAGYLIGHLLRT